MKIKLLIAATAVCIIAACGGNSTEQAQNNETSSTEKQDESSTPKGKQLISQSDCMSCHADKSKVIGPSYVDVAQKYSNTPENVSQLAEKIIKGGQGVWGEIPMTPHPQISQEDAEEMVKYILSLN